MPDRRRPRIPVQMNPFGESALGSPWRDTAVDVPSINDAPFRTILLALNQMRRGAAGASIVITGEPGSGKTHLLARLRKEIGAGATFLYVRCNASGATLWRHVRAAVASDLLKREGGAPSRLHAVIQEHPERLETAGLNLQRVLTSYGEGRNVHAASAWLRGEPLPQSDLEALGIGVERDDEERSRESEARIAVHAMLSFLAPDPVLLCFDQMEALETYRGDRDGFHALGTMVADLHDEHSSHLMMISCIVSAFEPIFEELGNKANVDRWLEKKATLKPIAWEQAFQLIKARLDNSPELAPLRRAHAQDPLWPLSPAGLTPLFEKTGLCLPRTLIQACRSQFESLFGDEVAPRPKIDREVFLQQEFDASLREARGVVARLGGDKTLGEALPWLLQNSGLKAVGRSDKIARYANLAFQTGRGELAVALCHCGGLELTNRLKKIEKFWTTNPPGLKVICDPSVRPGSKGQTILATLKSRGGQVVHPLPEALAALQAIHDMVASARSGDLTQDGEPIGEREVNEWLLGNMPPQLEQLRDDLAGREPTDTDPVLPKLAALLSARKVMDGNAAAAELGTNLEEISACARRNPMRFGLLAGPPVVLFEAIEGSAPESSRA